MDKKFWISFVALFVISSAYGFIIHGLWLAPDYAQLPNVMRSQADADALMHFMILAHVSIAASMAWIYRQGRKDGDWMGQGIRFGLAMAFFSAVPFFMIYHTVAQFPFDLMVKQSVGEIAGLVVAGLAVAFVNK
jgi:hypothetical protein